jgi:hypothetical protein
VAAAILWGSPNRLSPKKRSEARERLLAAASLLFYAEGIKSVGIERIIKESEVTLATFYRHFPGRSTWSSPTCTVRTTILPRAPRSRQKRCRGATLSALSKTRRALSAWSSPSTASGVTSSSVEPSRTPATNFAPTPPVTS